LKLDSEQIEKDNNDDKCTTAKEIWVICASSKEAFPYCCNCSSQGRTCSVPASSASSRCI